MPGLEIKKIIRASCPSIFTPILDRIEASEISYRLARGAFWSIAGAVISRGFMFIAAILIARLLGKTVYGELGVIQSTVGMFSVFAGFGLGLTSTKHVAMFRNTDPPRAGNIIGISSLVATVTGGVMAAVLFVIAPWLATNTINAPHLAGVLRIGSVLLFLSALNGVHNGALSGFEAFKRITSISLFVGLVSFPVLVAGAHFGGLIGTVWALVISLGITLLLNYRALRKEARRFGVSISVKGWRRDVSVLWSFSLPAVLTGLLVGPVEWICHTLLVNQPDGYGQMGILNAANQWYTLLSFIPLVLGQVFLPILSERFSQKDTKPLMTTMVLSMKIIAIFSLPFVLLLSMISPYIMSLYGESFAGGWMTLVIVLFTAGLFAVQTPIGHVIMASGKMWVGFVMNMGWAITFVLGTLLLVTYGALGLAAARAFSYIMHGIWTFGFAILLFKKRNRVFEQ